MVLVHSVNMGVSVRSIDNDWPLNNTLIG